jgi:hypothetical protein
MNIINYKEFFPPPPPDKKAPAPKPAAKPEAAAGPAGPPARPQQSTPIRFNWSTPIVLSPHNGSTVFFGGNHLLKSVDRGDHWMIISPDLTTNDKTKLAAQFGGTDKPTGGITSDVTGAETHCTIITVSESPKVPGLIWVGTDDGNVQLTRDGGVTWTNITARFYDPKTGKPKPGVAGARFPAGLWCSRVEASRFDEGTCYVTFDGHRSDDFHPYVFKTTDFGKTWTAITAGIPDGHSVYVVREDPVAKNLLFLGTEFGVFFSRDAGATWASLKLNMPTVAFHDLLIHPREHDLIAATHGRGLWILDDITALRKATDTVLGQDAALFEPGRPGTRWLRVQRGGYGRGDLFFKGENPPDGAILNFYLKAKPAAPAALEISDPAGTAKTTYLLDEAGPGIGRIVWDLRFDPPASANQSYIQNLKRQIDPALLRTDLTDEQKAVLKKALADMDKYAANYRKLAEIQRTVMPVLRPGAMMYMGGMRGMGGPAAEPGTYAVKLTVNGKIYTGKVTVRLDPIQSGN